MVASIAEMRGALHLAAHALGIDSLRGCEGLAGRAYWSCLGELVDPEVRANFSPTGRSRRPPGDRFNALASFGYAQVFRACVAAVLVVGLDPAIGVYHTARSSSPPLVLDLLDLFRVALWDLPLVGAINRRTFDPDADFRVTGGAVYLSDQGRRKAITLFERRLEEQWKHPVTGYSLSYRRTVELEVRLLEKWWLGQPGLFARMRLR